MSAKVKLAKVGVVEEHYPAISKSYKLQLMCPCCGQKHILYFVPDPLTGDINIFICCPYCGRQIDEKRSVSPDNFTQIVDSFTTIADSFTFVDFNSSF